MFSDLMSGWGTWIRTKILGVRVRQLSLIFKRFFPTDGKSDRFKSTGCTQLPDHGKPWLFCMCPAAYLATRCQLGTEFGSRRWRPVNGYRFSIIPAAAVTDQALEPRDLQVLCLIGRHTDRNGWCRRSQVKMADELRCGRATVQRALERLYAARYLQRKLEGTRRGEPPAEGEQPFRAHSYRVLMDRDAAADELAQVAGVPAGEHGGVPIHGQGCPP
jgi:hypothetical protein